MVWLVQGKTHGLDGVQKSWTLKSWRYDGRLRWALNRILLSVGYELSEKNDTSVIYKTCRRQWEGLFERVGLDINAIMGQSFESARKTPSRTFSQDLLDVDYWISTEGLIFAWNFIRLNRRRKVDMFLAHSTFGGWLNEVCDARFAETLLNRTALDTERSLCRLGEAGCDLPCQCWKNTCALQPADRGNKTPQILLTDYINDLINQHQCKCCQTVVLRLVKQLAQHIDMREHKWGKDLEAGSDIWLAGRSNKRRRCFDQHQKLIIATSTTATPSEIARNHGLCKGSHQTTALQWRAQWLQEMRQTPHHGVHQLIDRAKMGRPWFYVTRGVSLSCFVSFPKHKFPNAISQTQFPNTSSQAQIPKQKPPNNNSQAKVAKRRKKGWKEGMK